MHTPRIFFDRHFTLRTPVSADDISPALISFFLSIIARLSFVPLSCTVKAHITLAWSALNLLGVLRSLNYLLAGQIRTKLFVIWYSDFMIFFELLVLFESFRRNNCLYHVFGNNFPTSLLRALEGVTLPRLFDLIVKEASIGSPAELMPTFFLCDEEFTLRMIIIAYFTIGLVFSNASLQIFILLFDD